MRGQDTTVEFYICNFPFIFDPIAKVGTYFSFHHYHPLLLSFPSFLHPSPQKSSQQHEKNLETVVLFHRMLKLIFDVKTS